MPSGRRPQIRRPVSSKIRTAKAGGSKIQPFDTGGWTMMVRPFAYAFTMPPAATAFQSLPLRTGNVGVQQNLLKYSNINSGTTC
jgi:hypothetical protein